ncbi:MAG: hypothetical protein M1503_01055 [Thaumarchaeota archaeon]|nr:hypothetical protein [Nitrososphaerota archaeon]MCL5316843.1 hypothetical protein [Nitrososphaerota archaeon]
MSYTFIPGEQISKEEDGVWYLGGHSAFTRMMVGQLLATTERLIFYEKRPTGSKTLEIIGLAFEIPLEKMIAIKSEKRLRRSSSKPRWDDFRVYREIMGQQFTANLPPSLLEGKEVYSVLLVAIEGDGHPESPTFEVRDPSGWLKTLGTSRGQAEEVEMKKPKPEANLDQ